MSRSFRTLLVFALAVGLLLGLGSFSKTEAVKIFGDGNGNFTDTDMPLSNCGGSCFYYGAYEYYGNQQVVAGIDDYSPYAGSENPVITTFQPGYDYNSGTAIAIRLKNGKFINPNYVTNGTSYCLVDPAAGNAVVATQVTTSYPTDTLNFVTTTTLDDQVRYLLAICDANNTYLQPNERVQINPNLGANCDTPVKVQIEWVSGNDCCTADLIVIYPKGKAELALNFTAELDSDRDFKTFLGGKDSKDLCCEGGVACNCAYGECLGKKPTTPSTGSTCPNPYVLGAPFNPATDSVVRVAFDIISENAEPGIDKIRSTNSNLTCTTSDNKTWRCSSNCIPCPECGESFDMYVDLKGNVENVPTTWTLANAVIEEYCYPDARVKAMCCSVREGFAGAWYGGVEAIIPFVKFDGTSNTYVKLFNRYSKDAKVYAEVFNKNSNSIIVALNNIATIPAGGAIQLSASDFQTLCPDCNWSFGQAVKLLIRVPSQTGCQSSTGTISLNYDRTGGTYSGTICNNNPYDPYIEGIVVSVMGGQQRSIPLLFKAFKQGQYNQ